MTYMLNPTHSLMCLCCFSSSVALKCIMLIWLQEGHLACEVCPEIFFLGETQVLNMSTEEISS